jgi:hypothetical protein
MAEVLHYLLKILLCKVVLKILLVDREDDRKC